MSAALIIWLERLASRCKVHGYAAQAAELRRRADLLNERMPVRERIDPADSRCRIPIEVGRLTELIELIQVELARPLEGEAPQPFSSDPGRVGSTVFAGTRVPLDIVETYRSSGLSISEFHLGYPSVERWQAEYAWSMSEDDLRNAIDRGRRT